MRKIGAIAVLMFFAISNSIFAKDENAIKKITINGKTQTVSIVVNEQEGELFIEALSLARVLGFTIKRQGELAILCTETTCLPFTVGEGEAQEVGKKLFISANAFFKSINSAWELDKKSGTLNVDLAEEMSTDNAPVDVVVGSTAPGFTLAGDNGEEIHLRDFLGKQHVVLEFFRSGGW